MKYSFDKLLTEHDFVEIIERVKNFDLFEFRKFDKQGKIELCIGMRKVGNGLWQDNLMCFVDGGKKYGDYHGFGHPYQRAEFLKLSFEDIVKKFAQLGLEIDTSIKQMSLFGLL